MNRLCLLILAPTLLLVLSGCATNRSMVAGGSGHEGLAELRAMIEEPGPEPSPAQYEATRARFVEVMQQVMVRQEPQARSSAGKVKRIIATAGAIIGLGGTVASLIVKNEDTRAAVAQASAGVAGVAGVVSLLPFGSESTGAVYTYLSAEMPRFEERWPATLDRPLTADAWAGFRGDLLHIADLVEELPE